MSQRVALQGTTPCDVTLLKGFSFLPSTWFFVWPGYDRWTKIKKNCKKKKEDAFGPDILQEYTGFAQMNMFLDLGRFFFQLPVCEGTSNIIENSKTLKQKKHPTEQARKSEGKKWTRHFSADKTPINKQTPTVDPRCPRNWCGMESMFHLREVMSIENGSLESLEVW